MTTRWDSLGLPVSPLSGLWSVWSLVSPPGVCMLYTNCTGDLIQKLTPFISTGRGKGTQTNLWSGKGAVLLASKNTVGYVTLYHYNSPLKALPRHLAYVWMWNWIHLCGNSNSRQSEKAPAKAHCTGEIKNVPTCEIKTYKHVYTSFTQHETCLIALVYTVFVAHSGKQGWLHKNSAGISNLVRVNKELLLFKIN